MQQSQQNQLPLTHQEKLRLYFADMERRGIPAYESAPPFFRFAWSRGSELEPPIFLPFWKAVWIMGGTWASLMMLFLLGPLFLLPIGLSQSIRFGFVLLFACGGFVFGFLMALYSRWKRKRLQLPDWKDYCP